MVVVALMDGGASPSTFSSPPILRAGSIPEARRTTGSYQIARNASQIDRQSTVAASANNQAVANVIPNSPLQNAVLGKFSCHNQLKEFDRIWSKMSFATGFQGRF